MESAEIAPPLAALLRGARPHRRPVGLAGRRRPHAAAGQRGHGAVQAVLPRRGDAALPARRPACRSACAPWTSTRSARPPGTARSSRCAATSPSATTSRSRRIPLAWELLTTAGGRRRLRAARGPAVGHRLPRRRRGRPTSGSDEVGVPAERIQRRGHGGQLLVHGRARARAARARRSTTTAAPSTAARAARSSTRTATSRSGTWSSCSTQLSAVRRKDDFDDPGRAAGEEHRHRPRPGADGHDPAGRRQHVRDRHHAR